MATLSANQIASLARQAGWSGEDVAVAVAVCLAESGGRTEARNRSSGACGLWQIHPPQPGCEDGATNARMGYAKWKARGWQPWSAHKSGAYKKHMATARAAAATVASEPVTQPPPAAEAGPAPEPPPPFIGDPLTVVSPLEGLSERSLDSLMLEGVALRSQVGEALTDATVTLSMEGASTLHVKVRDPHRKLLKSGLLGAKVAAHVDGVPFLLVQVKKSGSALDLVFEHAVVAALRQHTTPRKAAPNTVTRVDFARQLVAEEGWIAVTTPTGAGPLARVELARGSVTGTADAAKGDKPEGSWEAIGRLMDDVGWRRYVVGRNTLVLASEPSLLAGAAKYSLAEHTGGVDDIDFDFDIGKPVATVTLTVRAQRWDVYPGTAVLLVDVGPATGRWLVSSVERSLFSLNAKVTLVQARPVLSEPIAEPERKDVKETGLTEAPATVGAAGRSSEQVEKMVAFALSKEGGPYVWGGNGPKGYDCSGLTTAAAAAAGVKLARQSMAALDQCKRARTTVDTERAVNTRGALLFRTTGSPTHIALSLGNGQTIEAASRATGIRKGSARGRFNAGALVPGVRY